MGGEPVSGQYLLVRGRRVRFASRSCSAWLLCTSDRTCQNVRSLRPDWASGGSGGAAVWLDAVLAEQVAQPVELAVQPLVSREHGLTAHADCELLLQP